MSMRVTVEVSPKDMQEICRATGEKKKAQAIQRMLRDELMMIRRRAFMDECLSGEFGMELKDYERGQKLEQKAFESSRLKVRRPKAVAESSREA